ncbi:STY1053 family phage-associated protein [Achromobacter piechaudii]|uniref:STY1053 family phage-associated protein n=1 Tax=Achromobacter piechaudii TaxID=72556 RepID=UPI0014660F9D|nr:hypothetical protein [Achromobacter piechaudii]CAB3952715.1 hypothetical protein LMG6103_03534 [Achromobacter piechaudii]
MPKIYVNREFTVQIGGEKRHFTVGNHTVDADTAKHWYVQAHVGDEPTMDSDASAAADALLAGLDEKEKALMSRAGDLDAREAVIADREQAVQARETDVATREQALADREQAAQNAQSTPKDEGKASGKSTSK